MQRLTFFFDKAHKQTFQEEEEQFQGRKEN
jgi:hypothetical protein